MTANLVAVAATVAITPVFPRMKIDLNLTYTETGLLTTSFFVGYAAGQIISGTLSDRLGPKRVITASLVLIGLSSLGLTTARTGAEAYVWRLVGGYGVSGIFVPGFRAVVEWFDQRERMVAAGTHTGGWNAGIVIGAPASLAVSQLFGWRFGLDILALITLMFVPVIWLGLKPRRETWRSRTTEWHASTLLKERAFWIISFTHFIRFGAITTLISWIPIFLTENRSFDIFSASLLISVMGMFAILANSFGGWVSDRMGPIPIMGYTFVGLVPSMIMFSIIQNQTATWVIIIVMSGLFYAPVGAFMTLLPTKFGVDHAGSIVGYQNTIAGSGAFLLPFILGYIKDTSGSFDVGWWTTAVLLALAAIMMLFLRERKHTLQ